MNITGIVAEFDPFHEGHKYLIKRAREAGATHIAVCMSGTAMQRGELAVTDKYTRAAAAVKGGADIVAELPAPYSCSSAKNFALSAISILTHLGIDVLAFGSECDDAATLEAARRALKYAQHSEDVPRYTAQGMSYPAALAKAVGNRSGQNVLQVVSNPNSTLAVEYMAALESLGSAAKILPVKRVGAGHDACSADGEKYCSGMEIRRRLRSGELSAGFSPTDTAAAENVIYYHLLTADKSRLLSLPELGEPLADRILKTAAAPPPTLGEFLAAVKNKSCTYARIRRSALHLTLGITSDDVKALPPYIRIIAMNERGREILSRHSSGIPVSVSIKKLADLSPSAARTAELENRAVRLMQLCTGEFLSEYRRKISLQN